MQIRYLSTKEIGSRFVCDGIHGVVPPQKQSVYVTGLSMFSLLEPGKCADGGLKEFQEHRMGSCRVSNPMPDGGRERESVKRYDFANGRKCICTEKDGFGGRL